MTGSERRDFLRAATAALAASPWLARAGQAAASHDMGALPASWTGREQIGMLLYPAAHPPEVVSMVSDMFVDFGPRARAALASASGKRPPAQRNAR